MTVTGSAHTAWMRFPTGHQIEHLATGYKMTVIPLFMVHPLILSAAGGSAALFRLGDGVEPATASKKGPNEPVRR